MKLDVQLLAGVAVISLATALGGAALWILQHDPATVFLWPTASAEQLPLQLSAAGRARGQPTEEPETVDDALDRLEMGRLAFNAPEQMTMHHPQVVHLVLSGLKSSEELTLLVREAGPVETADVRMAEIMEAQLQGAAFRIGSLTPAEQAVSARDPTEWKWEVEPLQTGPQRLHLTLTALLQVDGRTVRRAMTFERQIEVEVATGRASWVWPAAALLLASAAGLVMAGLRRMRRPSLSNVKSTPGAQADIFVSYTRRDQDRVVTLVQGLQAQGFRLWMDQAGIEGATLWSEEIVQALRGARVVLFFASPAALASPHVMREISLASEENKKILPVFLAAADVPPALRYHLAGIQHLQVEHMATAAALEAIQRALHRAGVGP